MTDRLGVNENYGVSSFQTEAAMALSAPKWYAAYTCANHEKRVAERLHERANRIWSATLGPNHPYVARGLDALAAVADARGQRERARGLYQRALAIRKQTVGSDHPDVAWTLTFPMTDPTSARCTAHRRGRL